MLGLRVKRKRLRVSVFLDAIIDLLRCSPYTASAPMHAVSHTGSHGLEQTNRLNLRYFWRDRLSFIKATKVEVVTSLMMLGRGSSSCLYISSHLK
jgi:hypothetical protein